MTRGTDGSKQPLYVVRFEEEPVEAVVLDDDGNVSSVEELTDDELAMLALVMIAAQHVLPTNLVEAVQDECGRRLRASHATQPCPCDCNRGGFCGGCGHAGCGRR